MSTLGTLLALAIAPSQLNVDPATDRIGEAPLEDSSGFTAVSGEWLASLTREAVSHDTSFTWSTLRWIATARIRT